MKFYKVISERTFVCALMFCFKLPFACTKFYIRRRFSTSFLASWKLYPMTGNLLTGPNPTHRKKNCVSDVSKFLKAKGIFHEQCRGNVLLWPKSDDESKKSLWLSSTSWLRPMRSMPARLSGVWLGSWWVVGASTRYISAFAVSRVIVVPSAATSPSPRLDCTEFSRFIFLSVYYAKLAYFLLDYNQPVFLIHDILVWIRIRGSMPLTNGSGSGFGSESCCFRHWPLGCQ